MRKDLPSNQPAAFVPEDGNIRRSVFCMLVNWARNKNGHQEPVNRRDDKQSLRRGNCYAHDLCYLNLLFEFIVEFLRLELEILQKDHAAFVDQRFGQKIGT